MLPDADGVKTPEAVTPVPDHIPPEGDAPLKVYATGWLQTEKSAPAFTCGIGFQN